MTKFQKEREKGLVCLLFLKNVFCSQKQGEQGK